MPDTSDRFLTFSEEALARVGLGLGHPEPDPTEEGEPMIEHIWKANDSSCSPSANAPEFEPLLNVDEAAKLLGVARAWIVAHASGRRAPFLPSYGLGRKYMFRRSDLEGFVQDCRIILDRAERQRRQRSRKS